MRFLIQLFRQNLFWNNEGQQLLNDNKGDNFSAAGGAGESVDPRLVAEAAGRDSRAEVLISWSLCCPFFLNSQVGIQI